MKDGRSMSGQGEARRCLFYINHDMRESLNALLPSLSRRFEIFGLTRRKRKKMHPLGLIVKAAKKFIAGLYYVTIGTAFLAECLNNFVDASRRCHKSNF